MRRFFKIIGWILLIGFALIGFLFSVVFVGMQFGLFNVRGSIDERNNFFINAFLEGSQPDGTVSPNDIENTAQALAGDYSCSDKRDACNWNETREWQVVAGGLSKDAQIIARVSAETGVPARLIAAVVVPEQIRFFTANREVFKRYFEPLKLLGSLSKFSLGVSGIKQDTAEAVERYANDPSSPLYPGEGYAQLIAYQPGVDTSEELFLRLTNEKDHYYSYLYTAIFIKEVLKQWERAGYDITNDPAIVATIFNLGFSGSRPNANPQVAGTTITVGGENYSFGRLAGLFYNSSELTNLLP